MNPQQQPPLNIEATTIFSKAKHDFLNLISAEERAQLTQCGSALALLEDLRQLKVVSKNTKRCTKLMRGVKTLADALMPYFKVIEILCGSKPEVANIVWGTIRLLLELASNFVTFFERLCDVLRDLAVAVPHYEDALQMLGSVTRPTTLLRNDFYNFYADLFDFFQSVSRVFTKKNGHLKKTPVMIADLFWRPFDIRFRDILDRMKLHKKVLKDELVRANFKALHSMLGDLASGIADIHSHQHRNNKNDVSPAHSERTILKWINPTNYKTIYQDANQKRTERTTEWIFAHPEYQAWDFCPRVTEQPGVTDVRQQNILWVQGNPGWGKTITAASVVEALKSSHDTLSRSESDTLIVTAYYFFNQAMKEERSVDSAYRALTAQVLHQCRASEQVCAILDFAFDDSISEQLTASVEELLDLLRMCLPLVSTTYFVLDGIDECDNDSKLLKDLRDLANRCRLKIILFSRPNVVALRRNIENCSIIRLERRWANADIARYLDEAIPELQDNGLLPSDMHVSSIRDKLIGRADGMFLWARLMIGYLESPSLSEEQRIVEVSKVDPEGLDDMYARILSHIRSMTAPNRSLARTVFKWVAFAAEPISSIELYPVVWPDTATSSDQRPKQQQHIDNAIIICCGGLIEHVDSKLAFIHLTAKDYVTSTRTIFEGKEYWAPSPMNSHIEISNACLSYLCHTLPPRPLSGNIMKTVFLDQLAGRYPLLRYATLYWPWHAFEAIESEETGLRQDWMTKIFTFLQNNFATMVWFEALYIVAIPGDEASSVSNMVKVLLSLARALRWKLCTEPDAQATSSIGEDLYELAQDLGALNEEWGFTLLQRPNEIWNDANAFTSSRFILKSSALGVEEVKSLEPQNPLRSCDAVSMISQDAHTHDGRRLAKLSIFKPKSQAGAQGWGALYELFEISSTTQLVGSAFIPLEPSEIILAGQQSPKIYSERRFKVLSRLSRGLTRALIFRMAYDFDIDTIRGGQIQYKSCLLDMSFNPLLNCSWTLHAKTSHVQGYNYWCDWQLASDGDFVLFKEIWTPNDLDVFAIFHLKKCETGFYAVLLKQVLLERDCILDWHADINSSLNMVIFPIKTDIWLWRIVEGNQEMEILCTLGSQESFRAGSGRKLRGLSFSQCGKYVCINLTGEIAPIIVPIPEAYVQGMNLTTDTASATSLNLRASSEHTEGSMSSTKRKWTDYNQDSLISLATSGKIPKVVDNTLVVMQEPTDSTQRAVFSWLPYQRMGRGNHGINMSVMLRDDDRDSQAKGTVTRLVNLPKRLAVHSAKASLILPDENDHRVTIILNQAEKRFYNFYEESLSAPIVFRKDPLAILASQDMNTILEAKNDEAKEANLRVPGLTDSFDSPSPLCE